MAIMRGGYDAFFPRVLMACSFSNGKGSWTQSLTMDVLDPALKVQ